MEKVKWILQQNLIKPTVLQQFTDACERHEISFEKVFVIPFSPDLPEFSPAEKVIFYGSTTLMLNAFANEKWRSGVYYSPENFSMEAYLKHWGDKMLNFGGRVVEFGEFVKENWAEDREWFLRPDADDKAFSGGVRTFAEIVEWHDRICKAGGADLTTHTPVFVAESRTITREWRNFIVNGKVVASSRYMLAGELNVNPADTPPEMIAFCESCAAAWQPHDIFVMDIAEADGEFRIIECNCFNGTGIYDHDVEAIVTAVTQAIIEK